VVLSLFTHPLVPTLHRVVLAAVECERAAGAVNRPLFDPRPVRAWSSPIFSISIARVAALPCLGQGALAAPLASSARAPGEKAGKPGSFLSRSTAEEPKAVGPQGTAAFPPHHPSERRQEQPVECCFDQRARPEAP
jgi:hypothetical protein